MSRTSDVLAAGGLVWRTIEGERRIGLVHRERYGGDVTIPKGHVKKGESIVGAAVREVAEELGCEARPREFAGATAYVTDEGQKYVLFWHMDYVRDADDGPDGHEVSERTWVAPHDALRLLSYDTERRLLSRALDDAG